MSKMSKAVTGMREEAELRRDEVVENFMGGDSYKINPLDTMKMVTASSIFGEPAYYRDSKSCKSGVYGLDTLLCGHTILDDSYRGKTTEEIMEKVIDDALNYDFYETIRWAKTLRQKYNMRLNPQVIMVRAAIHPKRKEFTKLQPGAFDAFNQEIMSRPDEPLSQMAYYLFKNKGKKNNIPSIIKRSWAHKISNLGRYAVAKYKNHEIGMINGVRLCHASSPVINELMRTGTIEVEDDQKTWENLRSEGKSWKEIFKTIDMGHMALLRNLRGVFEEVDDIDFCREYLSKLTKGVETGKQFPFRYYSAYKAVGASSKIHHKSLILDCLAECIDIATVNNFPKLKGKTMCLSDNSGSAWGTFNSEYGTVTVADIDNLSSVITASCSDEGYVGKFGDNLKVYPVTHRDSILTQSTNISCGGSGDVGGGTEGGIWKFFRDAIEKKEHWDNIFIYSDQQAGHGGLYGTALDQAQYCSLGFNCRRGSSYINVFALIQEYRKKVNPKVNVFSVQTAGYDNVVIPEQAYRTSIMYGWTGKEALYAKAMIDLWDGVDENNSKNKLN